MTSGAAFWLAIALGGIATYAVRAVLLLLAGRLTELPWQVREGLRMIPAAALAALTVPAVLRPDGPDTVISLASPELVAAVLAGAVAWRTRNLLATIATGLVAVVALQSVMG